MKITLNNPFQKKGEMGKILSKQTNKREDKDFPGLSQQLP